MHSPLRHMMAVCAMVITFVAALMYCITPDAMDAWFSVARHRAQEAMRSVSTGKIAAAVAERVSAVTATARAAAPKADPVSEAKTRAGRAELAELRTGPDPFRPYSWRSASSGFALDGLEEYLPQTLGGLATAAFAMWVRRRGRRLRRNAFVRDARMAAGLARAVRQMESW